jgi:hypothetical protein
MALSINQVGNKSNLIKESYLNNDTVQFPLGCPVMWDLSSTVKTVSQTSTLGAGDGENAKLPSTVGSDKYQLVAGINLTYNCQINQYGLVAVHGYCPSTLVKLNSRATSTDSWASVQSVQSGQLLVPDFVNNVWQILANVAAQSTPQLVLLDSFASIASAASNASVGGAVTNLVSNGLYRSYVRYM